MSWIHFLWSSTELQESAMTFAFLFSNSGTIFATTPSSVVQTGVKSAGWENSTPHLCVVLQ